MNLSPVNSSRGAPMGRPEQHNHNATGLVFELEWVPLTDGAYDCGGAYWGGPANLYCAQADEGEVTLYIRAASRETAKQAVEMLYPRSTFLPVNGSLIKQTIKFLEDCINREGLHESHLASVEEDISDLQSELDERGLT